MIQFKLFIKSIVYSSKLIFSSSGPVMTVYLLLNLVSSTLTLFSTVALKYVLDYLSAEEMQVSMILLWSALYGLSIIIVPANNAALNITYDSIVKRARHRYECDLAEKLADLPLSFIDSSEGKDMIDDVRYSANTCIFTSYRIVQIISLLYTFAVSYITLVKFDVGFAFLFLILTIPGIILNQIFDKKAEDLRREQAPDVRKFSYYRWMLTDPWPAKDVRMYDCI